MPTPAQFISVAEARQMIRAALSTMPRMRVPYQTALGYTLAEPLVGQAAIPPFDNSAMDGFAVRMADLHTLPATLPVGEDIPAGKAPQYPVRPGTCARIMTGAPLPEGADAVVPVEWTEPTDTGIRFLKAPTLHQHMRRAGADVQPGDVLAEAGTVITPPTIGMLATLGVADVLVHRPPRVGVLATGDELVDVEAPLGPGQIRNANGPALAAQIRHAGGEAVYVGHAPDQAAAIQQALHEALAGADALVISGGVSVGDYDLVKQELDRMGLALHFWKIRQRPGKPMAFGVLGTTPVFGLPGNPVSSAVCFDQYVRPALAYMLGRTATLRPLVPARLAEPVVKKPGLHYFVRGIATFDDAGRLTVRTTGPQGSNLYSSFLRANCLVHLPEPLENPPAGTPVEIEWLWW